MRCSRVIIAAMATLCVAVVHALPVQQPEGLLPAGQDLDKLMIVETDNEAALRSKRTIGLLRTLFPEISQLIEQKVNMITGEVIRVVGPVLLRMALNRGGASEDRSNSAGTTVEVSSPFGDDEDDSSSNSANEITSRSGGDSRVSIELPTFPPEEATEVANTATDSTTVTASSQSSLTDNETTTETQSP